MRFNEDWRDSRGGSKLEISMRQNPVRWGGVFEPARGVFGIERQSSHR